MPPSRSHHHEDARRAVSSSMITQECANGSRRFFIWVNPVEFRLWWIFFLLFHVVCAGYHAIAWSLYYQLPTTNFSNSLANNSIGLKAKYYPLISIIMALLSIVHGTTALWMVVSSIHARQLTYHFFCEKKRSTAWVTKVKVTAVVPSTSADNLSPFRGMGSYCDGISSLRNTCASALYWVFGLFSIEGKHFGVSFVTREVFETVLQTIQAYRLALYVPRPWLVQSLVVLLVFSCWSTPVMRRIFGNSPAQERMVCLLFDVTLDSISTIVIPVILAVPYISQYEPMITNFPVPKFQDSRWRALAMNEFRLILVSSWLDLITRVTLSICSLAVLFDVKAILRVKHRVVGPKGRALSADKTRIAHRQVREPSRCRKMPVFSSTPSMRNTSNVANPLLQISSVTTTTETRIERFLHLLLTMLGFGVLVVHVVATIPTPYPGCILPVLTWGRLTPGCAYVKLDCLEMGMHGLQDEMETFLSKFDPVSLQVLDITACPDLWMPSILQSFHQLSALKLTQSTVLQWGADAALTSKYHPLISQVLIASVQLPGSTLPRGLTDPGFPPSLVTFAMNDTHLNFLPIELANLLPSGSVFALEFCGLTSVPDIISEIPFYLLSLAGNHLTTVPVALFYAPVIRFLDLTGNPITELPDISEELQQSLGGRPAPLLVYLDMSATELTAFPQWLEGRHHLYFGAVRTPLCDRILAHELVLPDEQHLLTAVDCVTWTGVGF